jgi:hypothetical protein
MAGSDRGQENCRDELYPLGACGFRATSGLSRGTLN